MYCGVARRSGLAIRARYLARPRHINVNILAETRNEAQGHEGAPAWPLRKNFGDEHILATMPFASIPSAVGT